MHYASNDYRTRCPRHPSGPGQPTECGTPLTEPPQTRDLLDLAGNYIDFLKFAFGTSAFYGRDLLRKRYAGQEHGVEVYPGGRKGCTERNTDNFDEP